ncbi:hypothetical protein BDZ91DRAFT_710279 [Kalaharituber pfeilii]|nr:hypothetical protein BDZ91DRAFT_710279 [Kalaharituber pfeilii]
MAPSVNSPLHPIVIPEIAVPPHFTCLGSGLLQNGHSRESAASLAALLLPSPAAPRGIANNSKPKTWWRAQCLHYGIDMPASANIERMRARLEEGLRSGKGGRGGEWGLVVPAELLDLEYAKCGEFRKLNAQVREAVSGAGGENAGKGKGKSKDKVEKGNDKLTKEPSKTSAKKKEPAPKKSIPAPAASEASTKKSKAKEQKELTVVTTTTITTTTTKNAKAGASRCGSGAGTLAPKAKSKPAERKQVVKGGGVSKSKASSPKKTAAVKKEIKKEGTYLDFDWDMIF